MVVPDYLAVVVVDFFLRHILDTYYFIKWLCYFIIILTAYEIFPIYSSLATTVVYYLLAIATLTGVG